MKIFNKKLEKRLLDNDCLLELKYLLSMSFMAIVLCFSIALPIMFIIGIFINHYPTNFIVWVLIMLLIFPILFTFLIKKFDSYIKRKLISSIQSNTKQIKE